MRIAILGTRGIPNRYGGFERFAEVISSILVKRGISVTVLSSFVSANAPQGVDVVYIATPKWLPTNLATLLYDLKLMRWAATNNVDIILQCGYSFACWLPFFSKRIRKKVITNPDGLEYKRQKWNFFVKQFLKLTERIAIKQSAAIVLDNPMLLGYYTAKYGINPSIIPYGSFINNTINYTTQVLGFNLPKSYYLAITRPTPENSITTILDTFSQNGKTLIMVGPFDDSQFGRHCIRNYAKFTNIKFVGGIYDQNQLDLLRLNAVAYIHGHQVGGTNPSLLEAMGCGCFVIAHNNPFNSWVLNNNGLFFDFKNQLASQIEVFEAMSQNEREATKQNNLKRISNDFNWNTIADRYIEVFIRVIENRE